MSKKLSVGGCLSLLLLAFIALIFEASVYGLVLAQLWVWFVVPLGAPVIGIAHAFGLALLLRYVIRDARALEADSESRPLSRQLMHSIGMTLARGGIVYVMASIVAGFMA